MPEYTTAAGAAPDVGIVHVIQSSYRYNGGNGTITIDQILKDEGWFEDAESAAIRCEQLNAKNQTFYERAMDRSRRGTEERIRRAIAANEEAAILRAAGVDKRDVTVPLPFEPEPFETFIKKQGHTVYTVIEMHRSDHDGIAQAGNPGTDATEDVASGTA